MQKLTMFHAEERPLPNRSKSTDEILEELLNESEPERPLRGHEIIRMICLGNIPPGDYRYESVKMDGSTEIETFSVNKNGRITKLKTWIEKADSAKDSAKSKSGKRKGTP